jgi:hypothetical protein
LPPLFEFFLQRGQQAPLPNLLDSSRALLY